MVYILFGSLALFIIIGTPIAVSVGLSSVMAMFYQGIPFIAATQRFFTASDSFPLLAIPFFMLAGKLMEFGGISKRLINLANNLVGFVEGGLGVVSVLACLFFGAICGSSTSTVAAIGSMMIPAMVENGYSKKFACALIATAASLGILIPPSIPMIVYGVVMGVSIADLFVAGIGAGLFSGFLLVLYIIIRSKISGFKGNVKKPNILEILASFRDAIFAIFMPLIVLGGIYSGIFTPTEAAAVACIYSFLIGFFVYHEITFENIPNIILSSMQNTAVVMLIIAASSSFGWIITMARVPQNITAAILSLTLPPSLIIIGMLLFLVFIGTFMEGNAYIIILAPLFAPMVSSLGINLVLFGIVMVVSVCVGTITPPLGVNLFTTCSIYPVTIEEIVTEIVPFVLIMSFSLIVLTFVPEISLFLVNLTH